MCPEKKIITINSRKKGNRESAHPLIRSMRYIPDLLYPRRCPLCDEILQKNQMFVCGSCSGEIHFLKGALCMQCGKPLEDENAEYCFDCRKKKHVYRQCFSPFLYRGRMKESILRFKYMGRAEYASFYAEAIVQYGVAKIGIWKPDLIVPVPVHRQKLISRGYNQAEVLGRKLSVLTGIPCESKAVIRIRKTEAQKNVSGTQRSRNLARAFQINRKKTDVLQGKAVLLVDDIYTTGSTSDAVSSVLLADGVKNVFVVCICISPGSA